MNTVVFFFIIWIVLSGGSAAVSIFLLQYPLTSELLSKCLIMSWIISLILVIVLAIAKDGGKKEDVPTVK